MGRTGTPPFVSAHCSFALYYFPMCPRASFDAGLPLSQASALLARFALALLVPSKLPRVFDLGLGVVSRPALRKNYVANIVAMSLGIVSLAGESWSPNGWPMACLTGWLAGWLARRLASWLAAP